MDRRERNDLAERALANVRFRTRTGFARADCPFCLDARGKADHKACLAVNDRTGWYRCWKCGASGRLDRPDDGEWGPSGGDAGCGEQTTVEPPEGFLELCVEPGASSIACDEAREYLRGRGLPPSIWEAARIGCCLSGRWGGRVVIPVLSPAGDWWGWVSRIWSRDASDPYRTAPGMVVGGGFFNHAALYAETDEPLMICEGCFDALPYWPDAVACLGKPKAGQVASLLETARPIAVVLDGDAWEEAEMLSLRLQFDGKRSGFVRLPPKRDPNTVDPAWLREEVRRCL